VNKFIYGLVLDLQIYLSLIWKLAMQYLGRLILIPPPMKGHFPLMLNEIKLFSHVVVEEKKKMPFVNCLSSKK
jgi:hypothetical protein